MHLKVLKILKSSRGDCVSSKCMSDKLDISQGQVNALVRRLRAMGYGVVFERAKGYRLENIPDRLYPHEIGDGLKTHVIGANICYYDRVSSTNDIALEMIKKGSALHGTLVVAESQHKGRGRFGRRWVSPRASGLWFSAVLEIKGAHEHCGIVSAMCALACAEVLNKKYGIPAMIKWPNDVYVNGKKIAGILTELAGGTLSHSHIVAGIGLDYNLAGNRMPAALKGKVTDLVTEAKNIARGARAAKLRPFPGRIAVMRDLLHGLDAWYKVFSDRKYGMIIRGWRRFALDLGGHVKVVTGSTAFSGRPVGISDTGALLLETSRGRIKTIYSGDIISG